MQLRWRPSEVHRACANMCFSRFLFWGPKRKPKTKGTVPLPHCSRCIIACMCRARSFVARRLGPERARVLNIAATALGEDRPLAGSPMCWRSGPLLLGDMEQQRINIEDKACISSALGFASVRLRLNVKAICLIAVAKARPMGYPKKVPIGPEPGTQMCTTWRPKWLPISVQPHTSWYPKMGSYLVPVFGYQKWSPS